MDQVSAVSKITVRLPDFTLFTLNITGITCILVKDLKLILFEKGINVLPSRMKLVFRNRCLGDVEVVQDLNLTHCDSLQLIIKVTEDAPLLLNYDEFIASSVPKHNAVNVPIDSAIKISFKPNRMGQVIYTPSLLHYKELQTLFPSKQAISDTDVPERVLLLQVDATLELRLESLLYSMEGSHQVLQHNWQRYSSHPPISCAISASPWHASWPHEVSLQPCQPLQHNRHYALLLCHNVPVVPMEQQQELSVLDYLAAGIGRDKLVLFRTEKPASHAGRQARIALAPAAGMARSASIYSAFSTSSK
jgi:hypothetical protein